MIDITLIKAWALSQAKKLLQKKHDREFQLRSLKKITAAAVMYAALVLFVPGVNPITSIGGNVTLLAGAFFLTFRIISIVLYVALLLMVPTALAKGIFNKNGKIVTKAGFASGLAVETSLRLFPAMAYLLIFLFAMSVVFTGVDGLLFVMDLLIPQSTKGFLSTVALECFVILVLYADCRKFAAKLQDGAHELVYGEKPGYRESALGRLERAFKSDIAIIRKLYRK